VTSVLPAETASNGTDYEITLCGKLLHQSFFWPREWILPILYIPLLLMYRTEKAFYVPLTNCSHSPYSSVSLMFHFVSSVSRFDTFNIWRKMHSGQLMRNKRTYYLVALQ